VTEVDAATTRNRTVYRDPEIVRHYAQASGLSSAEKLLFDRHIIGTPDVLDVGVGGGRTTPPLVARSMYVGIDSAFEMVRATQGRCPRARLAVGDVTFLPVGNSSFDVVVFSFNGIDYVVREGGRDAAYAEIHRVLRPGGIVIFSSHNPRFVKLLPVGRSPRVLSGWARQLPGAARQAIERGGLMSSTRVHFDPVHGGLFTYQATPKRVRRELAIRGFSVVDVVPSTHPRRGIVSASVPWFYYAARRAS
jgi:SAM-dependent methyltransferase